MTAADCNPFIDKRNLVFIVCIVAVLVFGVMLNSMTLNTIISNSDRNYQATVQNYHAISNSAASKYQADRNYDELQKIENITQSTHDDLTKMRNFSLP